MANYAENTSVPVERSRAEIEGTVMRYGATGFISGWHNNAAMVSFEMKDRRIRFLLPLPDPKDERFHFTKHKQRYMRHRVDEATARKNWEQGCRQKWRALALLVKAKMEAVESGIQTFEEEFLNNIVMSTGMTIGEQIVPRIAEIAATGMLPPLLPAPPAN